MREVTFLQPESQKKKKQVIFKKISKLSFATKALLAKERNAIVKKKFLQEKCFIVYVVVKICPGILSFNSDVLCLKQFE